jgi:imidazole glycerol-phosphate synthase subunit HisH
MIAIINYGIGNLLSVKNMLKKAGVNDVVITDQEEELAKADKVLLPGVGHFDYGMRMLRQSNCFKTLEHKALVEKVPVLGICLGAQLLTLRSDEGIEPGLGWIDAETLKIEVDKLEPRLPIPHMGWSEIKFTENPLLKDLGDEPRFYFVHSYYMKPKRADNILCESIYGNSFASGIVQDNIFGVQFHPEKSHKYGLKLLENFAKI